MPASSYPCDGIVAVHGKSVMCETYAKWQIVYDNDRRGLRACGAHLNRIMEIHPDKNRFIIERLEST